MPRACVNTCERCLAGRGKGAAGASCATRVNAAGVAAALNLRRAGRLDGQAAPLFHSYEMLSGLGRQAGTWMVRRGLFMGNSTSKELRQLKLPRPFLARQCVSVSSITRFVCRRPRPRVGSEQQPKQ